MNNTEKSLISKGIASTLAKKLVIDGFTISKIKNSDNDILLSYGLTQIEIEEIKSESRPPIPTDTLEKLLFDTKFTCCVCRDSTKGIIVHHIVEWYISKSHDYDNLVVLCSDCHDKAHSKKVLTRNLDESLLTSLKEQWIDFAKKIDTQNVLKLANLSGARWDFINYTRLIELKDEMQKPLKVLVNDELLSLNIVDSSGILRDPSNWKLEKEIVKSRDQLYDFGIGSKLYLLNKSILNQVLEELHIIDITELINERKIKMHVNPSAWILYTGPMWFKKIDKKDDKRRLCYVKTHSIYIEGYFEPWYSTSNSAKHSFLSGRTTGSILAFVKDINSTNDETKLIVSILAIGNNFTDLKNNGA